MSVIVTANALSFAWSRGDLLLSNLNFQIERGEFISLVGVNGAGKTTLGRILLGLLAPTGGSLVWNQLVKIGYVPQFSQLDVHFPITAERVVMMGQTGVWGYPSLNRSKQQKVHKALRQVNLWEQRELPFFSLSGGQKQRILIARALCFSPDFLILDEPTASLDMVSTQSIYDLIREFSKEGKTIFAISHDINFVSSMTHRVFCLETPFVVHDTLHYLEVHHNRRLFGENQRALVCHGDC